MDISEIENYSNNNSHANVSLWGCVDVNPWTHLQLLTLQKHYQSHHTGYRYHQFLNWVWFVVLFDMDEYNLNHRYDQVNDATNYKNRKDTMDKITSIYECVRHFGPIYFLCFVSSIIWLQRVQPCILYI